MQDAYEDFAAAKQTARGDMDAGTPGLGPAAAASMPAALPAPLLPGPAAPRSPVEALATAGSALGSPAPDLDSGVASSSGFRGVSGPAPGLNGRAAGVDGVIAGAGLNSYGAGMNGSGLVVGTGFSGRSAGRNGRAAGVDGAGAGLNGYDGFWAAPLTGVSVQRFSGASSVDSAGDGKSGTGADVRLNGYAAELDGGGPAVLNGRSVQLNSSGLGRGAQLSGDVLRQNGNGASQWPLFPTLPSLLPPPPPLAFLATMLPGGGSAFAGNLWGPLNPDPNPTDSRGGPASTREALRFVLSPEGAFFRDFLTNEIVVSVDALSRAGAASLATSLGLGRAAVPVPLLGAARWWLPLAPALTAEDRQAIANVSVVRAHEPSHSDTHTFLLCATAKRAGGGFAQVAEYLTGGRKGLATAAASPRNPTPSLALLSDLAPLLAAVAPDLARGLASRVTARLLREMYVP